MFTKKQNITLKANLIIANVYHNLVGFFAFFDNFELFDWKYKTKLRISLFTRSYCKNIWFWSQLLISICSGEYFYQSNKKNLYSYKQTLTLFNISLNNSLRIGTTYIKLGDIYCIHVCHFCVMFFLTGEGCNNFIP